MKVVSCNPGQTEVSPQAFNACAFNIIDKWDPKQHAKTCDTMFYLRDGTGAYVWDCDQWIFLDFSGYTAPDWNAKENQQGYIKNKPFEKLGNFLEVSSEGVLSVNITPADIGAATKEDLDNHTKDKDNPHGVTATQVGAYSKTESDEKYTVKEDLTSHVNDKENPHDVTAHQVGALTAEESSANVIYQVIGKEKVRLTFVLDFKNKIADSTVENPNIFSWTTGSTLQKPSSFVVKPDQNSYDKVSSLDNVSQLILQNKNGTITQAGAFWDLLKIMKDELGEQFFITRGAVDLNSQIEILRKETILQWNVWGKGSGPSGNRLVVSAWSMGANGWAGDTSTTSNSITKIGNKTVASNNKHFIDNDGFVNIIAYAEAADGTTYSSISIDYANLEVSLEISMNEFIESMIAAYNVENPPQWENIEQKPFSSINPNQFITENDILTINDGILPNPNVFEETYDLNLGQGYLSVRQKFGIIQLTLVITDAVYQPNTKIYENGDIDSLMNQLFNTPRLDRINVYDFQNKTAPNIDSYLIEFSNYGIVFVADSEVTFRDNQMGMIMFTMIPNNEL